MPSNAPIHLTGRADGLPIKIVGIAAASGTTIHTASADAGVFDQVMLWAVNRNPSAQTLTLEIGGTAVDERVPVYLFPNVPIAVLEGHRISNGKILTGYGSVANDISVFGEVNRYTP